MQLDGQALGKLKQIELYPMFIFDGESAGTKVCGYNRMKFLLECLNDLNDQLAGVGARLLVCR